MGNLQHGAGSLRAGMLACCSSCQHLVCCLQAYLKRYGHQLSDEKRASIQQLIRESEEEDGADLTS
jgi:positive regulator of sigma E activity